MKKLVFIVCFAVVCFSSLKEAHLKGQIRSNKQQIYINSLELFNEINELRKEKGKAIPLAWDNILFYMTDNELNQIQSHPSLLIKLIIDFQDNFGYQLEFEKSYLSRHLIKSFGQVFDILDLQQQLQPLDLIQKWKESEEKLEVLLSEYQIGTVNARKIDNKLYIIVLLANGIPPLTNNNLFLVLIGHPGKPGPKGEKGDQGEPGVQGIQGEKGKSYVDIKMDGSFFRQLKQKYPNLEAIIDGYNILPTGELAGSCQEYKDQLGEEYKDGIYQIKINERKMLVYCEDGWTVLERRTHNSEFYQDWQAYANGFGDFDDDFWLGLQNIYELTRELRTLQFDLWSDEEFATATYSGFSIASGADNYTLFFEKFIGGTVKDSFSYHKGMPFSTYDRDNDSHKAHCAQHYKSGWWFKGCHMVNFNSPYELTGDEGLYYQGWKNPDTNEPMKITKAIMKIK